MNRILDSKLCVSLKDLAINGRDLLALGYEGPEIGQMLCRLLDRVLENPDLNDKEKLEKLLKNEV